jgi:protocatechuate 3,4-dioxygenase beta subunit
MNVCPAGPDGALSTVVVYGTIWRGGFAVNCSLLRSVVIASTLLGIISPATAGELRGRLLLGDKPATGVTVSAVPYEPPLDEARREARRASAPQPLTSVKTAPDGSFVLTVPAEPGKERLFTVRADGGGVVPAAIEGVWSSTESADLGEHVLLPASKLAGKVTDAKGTPVADAEVVLVAAPARFTEPELESAPRVTKTATDGTFRFDDAGARYNALTVNKPGLLVARRTNVKAGALQTPIVLSTGVPVAGVVKKTDGTSPAPGALVRVEGAVTTRWVETAEDGSFTIPNAPAGAVAVVADAGEGGYVEHRGLTLPLPEGKALTLVLRPPSAITGRTVDAKTGRVVPRAKIELRGGGNLRIARSGPDGTYALRGLPPQTWSVRADEPRYVPWIHSGLAVHAGENKKLDIPLVLGAILTGRVTDENGLPIAGAIGALSPVRSSVIARYLRFMRQREGPAFRTVKDGTFKATRLAPGENQILTVAQPDFETTIIGGVTLVGGATKTGLAVVLQRGAVISGVVKDGNAQPIAGAEITLSQDLTFRGSRGGTRAFLSVAGGPGGGRKGDTTGGDGRFSIRGVAPGEYAITVTRSGYATERVEAVKVAKGEPRAPIEVTLSPGAFIAGRVVHKSGTGAEGFTVFTSPSGGLRLGGRARSEQPTGSDGAFFVEGLKVGQSYDLQLVGPTGLAGEKHGVTAPASGIDLTVAGTGRITGHARDAQSGLPLTDFPVGFEPNRAVRGGMAQLSVRRAAPGQSGGVGLPINVHSEEGAFTLDDVPAGSWRVVVTADGYQPARTSGVVVEEGGVTDGVEVKVSKGVVVKGHVTDAQSGAPIANASVTFTQSGSPGAPIMILSEATDSGLTTDADGRFEADGLAPGTQTVHVTHPDYTDASQSFTVQADGASVEIHMDQGGVLGGTVTSDTGQPVAGADVMISQAGGGGFRFGDFAGLGSQPTVTDTAGRFSFDHLSPGRYTLAASLRSATSAPLDVVLQAGQPQENLVLQLTVGSTIQGTVSGLPPEMLTGATVMASASEGYFQSTRVGADATFEFDNVPSGVVTLRGTAIDATGSTRSVTKQVTASDDQPMLATELVFEQGFTLSGRVTQNGQPVGSAMVFAALQGGGGRQASARTDDSGSYTLAGLQDGTYTVGAVSSLTSGMASKRTTITLTSDQSLDIAFPSAGISGQVVEADSKAPLPDASVTIAAQDATGGPTRTLGASTDSNGQFSFTNLDEGPYALTASKPDYQLAQRNVTAAEEGTEGLVVELSRGAGIAIKVLDGVYGIPLRGVMVRVLDGQGSSVYGPASITLDSSGQGEIPSLPPGGYTVIADASGYAPTRRDGVVVPSPAVTLALTPGGTVLIQSGPKTLESGTASGTITSAIGWPVLLSLFNLQGQVVLSQPSLTLRNVPSGSYILSITGTDIAQSFTVNEGGSTVLQLP